MTSIYALLLIALGSIGAASFYIPFKGVKLWAWESYWIVQGIAAWLLAPWIFAWVTLPEGGLQKVLQNVPQESALYASFFGFLWGVGGLAFGLSIRYLGVALGQSIALGLCAAFGTIIPPLVAGENLFASVPGLLIITGVSLCIAGIVAIGYAGALKNKGLPKEELVKQVTEFALKKGLLIAVLAGVMSACFNFGFEAAKPIEELALSIGTNPLYAKNPSLIFILAGGFLFNVIYCGYLNIKNKTYTDYFSVQPKIFIQNISLSFLAGLLWFLQFHFFGMGSSLLPESMGAYGWSILMALNIAISNLWGLALGEWKGASKNTLLVLLMGVLLLVLSTFVVRFG